VGPSADLEAAEKGILFLQAVKRRSSKPELFAIPNELYRLEGNKLFDVLIITQVFKHK
jgi:hypothetical protein